MSNLSIIQLSKRDLRLGDNDRMTRRDLLAGTLLCSAAKLHGTPQIEKSSRFPGTPFRDYSRCLASYLSELAATATRKRDAALSKLTSPAAVRARQIEVRATLWKLIGGEPERTPLNPRITGTLTRAGYRVDKVVYESRPNLFVSANLYVPSEGQDPFPGVLFQSGHAWEGKAYPSYQRCCLGLVQLGFVVLAFDPMGQGERINYLNESGSESRLPDCDAEHTVPGRQMLLFGDSATRFQLWDAMRSLDYFLSLPIVDSKHVASVGHSGGATVTMLLAAADDRLSAAVVSMGNTENMIASQFRAPGATDDAEQDFVNAGSQGFDRWDLFYPLAPKPLLIWPSDRDFYATYSPDYVSNGWREYQKLRNVYALLGRTERLAWADTPLPHALAYDSRMRVYNWLTRWLKSDIQPVAKEPDVKPEPPSELWATDSGSVVRSLKSSTPFTINSASTPKREPFRLESLLKVDLAKPVERAKAIGRVKSRNVLVEVLEIQSDPVVWIPAFLLTPDNVSRGKSLLIVLDPHGNDQLWFHPEVDQVLPEDSGVICSADVRGVGSLRPGFSPGAAEYEMGHEQEENYAWGSLFLGRPLVGQRVTDLLAVVRALAKDDGMAGRSIFVAASGKLTVPAIFAAALEPSIAGLYLHGGLVSFQNVVETQIYHHPFANFVPNLLNHTDLPDLVAALAPRRVVLAGVVDASGDAMKEPAVADAYRAAKGNVSIEMRGDWSAKSLVAYASS
jgi:dienelactone hydrolase